MTTVVANESTPLRRGDEGSRTEFDPARVPRRQRGWLKILTTTTTTACVACVACVAVARAGKFGEINTGVWNPTMRMGDGAAVSLVEGTYRLRGSRACLGVGAAPAENYCGADETTGAISCGFSCGEQNIILTVKTSVGGEVDGAYEFRSGGAACSMSAGSGGLACGAGTVNATQFNIERVDRGQLSRECFGAQSTYAIKHGTSGKFCAGGAEGFVCDADTKSSATHWDFVDAASCPPNVNDGI